MAIAVDGGERRPAKKPTQKMIHQGKPVKVETCSLYCLTSSLHDLLFLSILINANLSYSRLNIGGKEVSKMLENRSMKIVSFCSCRDSASVHSA